MLFVIFLCWFGVVPASTGWTEKVCPRLQDDPAVVHTDVVAIQDRLPARSHGMQAPPVAPLHSGPCCDGCAFLLTEAPVVGRRALYCVVFRAHTVRA